MRIGITGSPGTGKTSIAKQLAQFYECKTLNEREFALKTRIGEFDTETNELEVPLDKLRSELGKLLGKENNIIVEGHLICEVKADFDLIIVLRCHPEVLEARLEARGYKAEKVQDNVFCEGIEYCKKHALRNYPKKKVFEVENRKSIKETMSAIIREIEKRRPK